MTDTWAQGLRTRWERFFHERADVRTLAVLRIGLASVVIVQLAALFPHVESLWSERGMLPSAAAERAAGGFAPSLLALLPETDAVLWVCYALFAAHALLLLVGYRTRVQAIAVLVWLVSFQNRNLLVVNAQDIVLRFIALYGALLPLGAALSVDALRRGENAATTRVGVWPLRLLQIQIALVVLSSGLWKLQGTDWVEGVAVYYVTRLEGFWDHLPVPAFMTDSLLASRVASWGTVAIELTAPILVWFGRTRRLALAAIAAFHAALAYSMNLFLFEWIMLVGWSTFLTKEDWTLLVRRRRALGDGIRQGTSKHLLPVKGLQGVSS